VAQVIPDPQVDYGILYNGAAFVPRRDGPVFQLLGPDDYYGFNDDTEAPDRAEAEPAVNTIAALSGPPECRDGNCPADAHNAPRPGSWRPQACCICRAVSRGAQIRIDCKCRPTDKFAWH
jgi:hypothetical protein